ncbi:MAG: sigma-54 dependent transcriptional regulator [Planctomycetaceae bacterium]
MPVDPVALIVTSDSELLEHLGSAVASRCQLRAYPCSNIEAAEILLRGAGLGTVFLDLRPDHLLEGTAGFLESLQSQKSKGVDLIAVSDGDLPIEVAVMADLLAIRHLHASLPEAEVNDVLDFVGGGGRVNGHRRAPEFRALSVNNVSIMTYTPAMFATIEELRRVAHRNVTLLLTGETGTGKTTMARMIHQLSDRARECFQHVACGALPSELIESELFGHTRGAFTGADRAKMGRFEAASRGTLLLDEIDVLNPKEQVKLLRVLETGQFEPVGSLETRTSHARLIVASNVDLEDLVAAGDFRSDLYYRLNVLQFHLLPLKQRVLDIVPFAIQFVIDCCREQNMRIDTISRDFLQTLKDYHWPGNLRELKNQIQRAVLFSSDGRLTRTDLNSTVLDGGSSPHLRRLPPESSLADRVAVTEQQILLQALRENDFNRTATARKLGLSRVGLYKKLRKHDLMERKS